MQIGTRPGPTLALASAEGARLATASLPSGAWLNRLIDYCSPTALGLAKASSLIASARYVTGIGRLARCSRSAAGWEGRARFLRTNPAGGGVLAQSAGCCRCRQPLAGRVRAAQRLGAAAQQLHLLLTPGPSRSLARHVTWGGAQPAGRSIWTLTSRLRAAHLLAHWAALVARNESETSCQLIVRSHARSLAESLNEFIHSICARDDSNRILAGRARAAAAAAAASNRRTTMPLARR